MRGTIWRCDRAIAAPALAAEFSQLDDTKVFPWDGMHRGNHRQGSEARKQSWLNRERKAS